MNLNSQPLRPIICLQKPNEMWDILYPPPRTTTSDDKDGIAGNPHGNVIVFGSAMSKEHNVEWQLFIVHINELWPARLQ